MTDTSLRETATSTTTATHNDQAPSYTRPCKKTQTSEERANLLLATIEDRKAVEPVMLDLRGKTLMADFFLICTGTSTVHIRSLGDAVLERVDEGELPTPRVEGREVGEWVLLDFGDAVLHVMSEEARERYHLEQFWTTPQPKGALFPTPDSVAALAEDDGMRSAAVNIAERDITDEDFEDEDDELELDEEDFDDEDDEAFFVEADSELPPIKEKDEDKEEDADDLVEGATPIDEGKPAKPEQNPV